MPSHRACCACFAQVELSQYQYLVPPHLRESKPSYFIVGGLVFTACSGKASLRGICCRCGACVVMLVQKGYACAEKVERPLFLADAAVQMACSLLPLLLQWRLCLTVSCNSSPNPRVFCDPTPPHPTLQTPTWSSATAA